MATTKYVLVDFENVHVKEMGALNGSALKVKLFLGANQVRVPLDVARELQAFGPDAEYVQIDGNGSNALDFHIAF
ncbi:MAG TPA: PIN domain-containing protein, partial [Burkholderiales bacterium]|nr:PIN domain-containing protein [Burkholderiales bacterium]